MDRLFAKKRYASTREIAKLMAATGLSEKEVRDYFNCLRFKLRQESS
jgi:predicted solute-binding protein